MNIHLGINTGFALNRFTPPEEWVPLIAETFGLKIVQWTADLLNPSLPDPIIKKQVHLTQRLCKKYGIQIPSTFTSALTRVNHLGHPDAEMRLFWIRWFKNFIDISVSLGAESVGSHLGILTVGDEQDPRRRKERIQQIICGWQNIAQYAAQRRLKYLLWEPMSIAREFGQTIAETKRIQRLLNKNSALPFKLCLDVDHGDMTSADPRDTDPYAWIEEFALKAPVIHIKQTLKDKSGHWPFTPQYNRKGKVTPQRLINALARSKVKEVTLFLELSFREREPFESRVIKDIQASINYWRPHVL